MCIVAVKFLSMWRKHLSESENDILFQIFAKYLVQIFAYFHGGVAQLCTRVAGTVIIPNSLCMGSLCHSALSCSNEADSSFPLSWNKLFVTLASSPHTNFKIQEAPAKWALSQLILKILLWQRKHLRCRALSKHRGKLPATDVKTVWKISLMKISIYQMRENPTRHSCKAKRNSREADATKARSWRVLLFKRKSKNYLIPFISCVIAPNMCFDGICSLLYHQNNVIY